MSRADFFGGDGTQAPATWDVAGLASKPLVDTNAINLALQFLGVLVGNHHDEFDALGLGRLRETEDWEQMAESQLGKIIMPVLSVNQLIVALNQAMEDL